MLTIRTMSEDDLPLVRAFLARVGLPDADVRAAKLAWVMRNPALAEGPGYLLAWQDGEVVAYSGQMPVKLFSRGTAFEGLWHQNVLVDPAMRGRGLASDMLREGLATGLPLLGLWANRAMVRVLQKASLRPVLPVRAYCKVYRAGWRSPAVWLPRAAQLVASGALALPRVLASTPRARYTVGLVKRFSTAHDELFARTLPHWDFIADRTSPILNWRYVDIPYRHYTRLQATLGTEVVAWAVIRMKDEGEATGVVIDYLTHPAHPAALEALLVEADRWFYDAGAAAATCRATAARYWRRLISLGFLPRPSRPTDCLHLANGGNLPTPAAERNPAWWYLNTGDSDGDL